MALKPPLPPMIELHSFSVYDDITSPQSSSLRCADIEKRASLLAMIEQQSPCHGHNSYDIKQLGIILGGAQKILIDYLSSTDITLTNEQLNQIEEMLLSKPLIHKISSNSNPTKSNESQSITYTFHTNHTYYHYFLGTNSVFATRMISFIYNPYWIAFLVLIGIFRVIWGLIEYESWSNLYHLTSLIITSIVFLNYILVFLTMNRKVFKKSIYHFVFWFKILTCIQSSICYLILRFVMLKDVEMGYITMSNEIIHQLGNILNITMYSAIDTFQLSRTIKICFGFVVSILWTLVAFNASTLHEHIEETTVDIGLNIHFSIASIYASAMRILSIFLWKQSFLLLIRKDRCVNIRHAPYIKWVTPQ